MARLTLKQEVGSCRVCFHTLWFIFHSGSLCAQARCRLLFDSKTRLQLCVCRLLWKCEMLSKNQSVLCPFPSLLLPTSSACSSPKWSTSNPGAGLWHCSFGPEARLADFLSRTFYYWHARAAKVTVLCWRNSFVSSLGCAPRQLCSPCFWTKLPLTCGLRE